MALIRSISGLRGIVGSGLDPDTVVRYTRGYAAFAPEGEIVVGGDGRPSGDWIERLVVGTLQGSGRAVRRIGVAPTPTVQLATERSDAAGGISITASHNPSEWNGLKFLDQEGIFLDPAACERLFELVDRGPFTSAGWGEGGTAVDDTSQLLHHVELAVTLPFVDRDALRRRRFRVVVDAVNASGSRIVPMLLEELGAEVIPLYCNGTGLFPHTPEPLPVNLGDLSRSVRAERADLGIAVDPDADRLVLIDERGEPIGEEYTITLAADYFLAQEPQGIVVVNLSTTRAVDDVAARHGARVVRTPVGEINVARRMKELRAPIGGEGSGGVILPALHYGRDSLAGIVITLQSLLERGGSLSELRAALPSYAIVKKKGALPQGISTAAILEQIAADAPADAGRSTDDGLRLDFERSWVHLRGSNTEPIVRVIAEAPTTEEAELLATEYSERLETIAAQ